MKKIEGLLERFRNILGRDTEAKDVIIACIYEAAAFSIEPENITINNGVLEIKTTPARKNAIKLSESKLLQELKDRSPLPIVRIFYK